MQNTYIVNPGGSGPADADESRGMYSDPYHRWLENPNNYPGDWSGWDGTTVTPRTALTYNPVWHAVNLISADVAKIPINVYDIDRASRTKEIDWDHPAQRLIQGFTNFRDYWTRWIRDIMTQALIWNVAYSAIERTQDGTPVALYPLLPDRTMFDWARLIYMTEIRGQIFELEPADILVIEGIRYEGEDLELVRLARRNWETGLANENFTSKFFSNGARASGFLEIPQGWQKEAATALEEKFRDAHEGSSNAFKTIMLRDGARFRQASVNPNDAQVDELKDSQIEDVARWYSLPFHKMQPSANSSYNSLEQENRSYVSSTLSTWSMMICAELNTKLLTDQEKNSQTKVIDYDSTAFVSGDAATQVQIGVDGTTNGLFTVNEWRTRQGWNPIEGGDVLKSPLNIGTAGDDQVDQEDQDQVPPDESAQDRAKQLVKSLLQQEVRRISRRMLDEVNRKAPDRFATWWESRASGSDPSLRKSMIDQLELPLLVIQDLGLEIDPEDLTDRTFRKLQEAVQRSRQATETQPDLQPEALRDELNQLDETIEEMIP